VLVIRRYVPESPRWLAAHGHSERAETVMQEIESRVAARLGGSQLPEAKPQPIAAPARVGLTTLFSGVYAKLLEIASKMESNGRETTVKAARDTVGLDPAIKRNVESVAKKAFAASLALAGALLSQSAGGEERLIKGFDAPVTSKSSVRASSAGNSGPRYSTADLRVTPPSGRLGDQNESRNTYDSCGCDDACTYSPY
jgi:hypothetical protein